MSKRRELFKEKKSLNKRPKAAPLPTDPPDPESVVLTESAANEILRQGKQRNTPDAALRVGIRGGGCSGYSYVYDWAPGAPKEKDHVIEGYGAKVYIDHKSMKFLKGTVLDFSGNMMGQSFKFHNPNVKSSCGCGESIAF